MSELGPWLKEQLKQHGMTQSQLAVYAGVGQATVSDMLNKGHVPKVETLFRLADYFETSREEVLRLAGHLPPLEEELGVLEGVEGQDEALIRELIHEFRQVPEEWKPVAIEQVTQFRRLAELRPARLVAEEDEGEGH